MNLANELLVIVALTILNGFFSAAEIAILSVRRTRLEELAEGGSRGARAALALRQMPEHFLATVQVGITVLGATAGAFGGATLKEPLAQLLRQLGLVSFADQAAFATIVAVISLLSIVVGELVPKSLALRSSERVSTAVGRPLLWLARVAKPLVWFLTALSNLVLKPFRDQTTFTESRLSPDEIQQLVEESAAAGALSKVAGDIASRAMELAEMPVVALLVPRASVITLPRDAPAEVAWQILKAHPHARYPIASGGLDEVEGYVLAREVVRLLIEEKTFDLSTITRELPLIPESVPAVDALRTLQTRRTQLAVVVDEHGMNAGIVTVGDIAEELLGEVLAEHERPSSPIHKLSAHVSLVRGDTPVQQINRVLGTDLPISKEYTTIAGLLIHRATKILQAGEHVTLEDGVLCEVMEASPRLIRRVRITLPRASTQPPSAS